MTTLRERINAFLNPTKHRKARRSTGYQAAEFSRLTSGLASDTTYINQTLRYQLRTLRARSRQAAQNNPHARRFFQMVVDNVCGPVPFRLQVKIKNNAGNLDSITNKKIEDAWRAWGKAGNCDITGRFSWTTLQRLIVRTLAVDGEVLIRRVMTDDKYQLQLVDVDRLAETKNEQTKTGVISMGVEMDSVERPIAYHIYKRKPQSVIGTGYSRETERIPATEIIHLFVPEFTEQSRGVPWIYAALLNLVHLGAFEEAAVIAARVGASQMGFIKTDGGDLNFDGEDETGNPQMEADPGQFPVLQPGQDVVGWNPKYPDAAIDPFIKALLRGVASGLGVAYHNLSGDMEGVNYSSARIAELDERDSWVSLQNFTSEHLHQRIYESWLQSSYANQSISLPSPYLNRYYDVKWQARRWQWVDPEGEVKANIDAINASLKSRTQIIAEQGEDIEDVFGEIAEEESLAEQFGITLTDETETTATTETTETTESDSQG
jgi:lambda family phage portal protein